MGIVLIGLLMGLCLVLAGGITMLRTAFMRLSREQLEANLVEQQDRILSAFSVAYVFFILSAVILMTHYLLVHLGNLEVAIHCVILTAFIIPVTDVFPRFYVLRQTPTFNLSLLPWVKVVFAIFKFPAIALAFVGRQLMALFKPNSRGEANIFNTSEYYPLISRYYESGLANGSAEKKDHDIQRILTHFSTLPITAIMTKLSDIKVMDVEMPVEELITAVFESNASRILLYQERAENIVGILHTSLLMKSFCMAEGQKDQTDITSAISEPLFISNDNNVFDQLSDFSSRHEQYALIRDRNNVLQGAISIDMILEKLFKELKERSLQDQHGQSGE